MGGDEGYDEVDGKWSKTDAEVVDEVLEEARNGGGWGGEDVADCDIIKSLGGGRVGGIAIHARA